MSAEELYDRVKIDNLYFLATKGGITFGGGESLLHAEFLKEFRKVCGKNWRITVETSLNVKSELLRTALEVVDDFIVDIKEMNSKIYEDYTGKSIEQVLVNLQLLAQRLSEKHVRIRVPHIPDFNTRDNMAASVKKLQKMGFVDIEVFSYVVRWDK